MRIWVFVVVTVCQYREEMVDKGKDASVKEREVSWGREFLQLYRSQLLFFSSRPYVMGLLATLAFETVARFLQMNGEACCVCVPMHRRESWIHSLCISKLQ